MVFFVGELGGQVRVDDVCCQCWVDDAAAEVDDVDVVVFDCLVRCVRVVRHCGVDVGEFARCDRHVCVGVAYEYGAVCVVVVDRFCCCACRVWVVDWID